ncbi:hypothetical protein PUR71_01645, partial [Streptomyces sp. SP17BM10]|nr:hypothetical protein [Streptomyces sp. SP17BM10]
VLAARYTSSYHLTGGAPSASDSLGEDEVAAQGMPTDAAATAVHAAKSAFDAAFSTAALGGAGVALRGAVAAMVLLPARLRTADEEQAAEEAPVEPALVA